MPLKWQQFVLASMFKATPPEATRLGGVDKLFKDQRLEEDSDKNSTNEIIKLTWHAYRADSKLAPSQWETALLCNDVSHWLGANLELALCIFSYCLTLKYSSF